jgi:hypothetical protein
VCRHAKRDERADKSEHFLHEGALQLSESSLVLLCYTITVKRVV